MATFRKEQTHVDKGSQDPPRLSGLGGNLTGKHIWWLVLYTLGSIGLGLKNSPLYLLRECESI